MGSLSGATVIVLEDNHLDSKPAAAASAARQSRYMTRDSVLILLFGVIVFTCCPAPEFINFDARFALFAQEMLRNGPSFFPTTYHAPYPDYPAASTFLIYLVSLPFGRVTPFTAVLPTAVASALVLVVTYWIGAIRSRQRGLAAVLFALFTVEFLAMSRSIALDQYTSLATALSFYLAYSSDCLERSRRLWLLPLAWASGFAFRGPVGLLIPAAVTCVYYLWNARFKKMLLAGTLAGGMLVLGLGGLLLAARAQGGTPFMRQVLVAQMTGRFGERGPGFAYYWYGSLASCAVTYPLAILVVVSRFRDVVSKRTKEDRFLGVLILWVVVVLLAMSIPIAKKTRYVMPVIPALSLIASSLMVEASLEGLLLRTKRVFLRICAYLPLICAVGVGGVLLFACLRQPEWRMCSLVTVGLLIAPLTAAWKLDRGWRYIPDRDMYLLAVGVATFGIVHIGVVGPITYSLEKTGPFIRQVEALQEKAPGTISFFQVGPDAEDVKFMANLAKPLEPQFVSSIETLGDTPGTHYVIAKEAVFRSLPVDEDRPVRLLARGRIGHRDFVVFTPDGNR
jgi:4-amino-4-deoxy-L-arabinose transferase-like glycosyltransferase